MGKVRSIAGSVSLVLAVVFVIWLPLGIFNFIPFMLNFPGESMLRTHAGAAVASLAVSAWSYWDA